MRNSLIYDVMTTSQNRTHFRKLCTSQHILLLLIFFSLSRSGYDDTTIVVTKVPLSRAERMFLRISRARDEAPAFVLFLEIDATTSLLRISERDTVACVAHE